MSYISSQLSKDRSQVLVWERDKNGKRVCTEYDTPYYFYVKNQNGSDESIYGEKLKRYDFDNFGNFYNTKKDLIARGHQLYESDIRAEYKILSNEYYLKESRPLNIMLWDIEVDYDPEIGHATPANPYAPISAIAIHHYTKDKSVVYAVPPKNGPWSKEEIEALSKEVNCPIVICKNETQLLEYFLDELEDADIVSGWNSAAYDDPYTYERLKLVFGAKTAARMSFHNCKEPVYKEVLNKWKVPQQHLVLSGRVNIDYLELFIKFQQSNRDSYKLESIADEEFPDLPKIEYHGSLHRLYNEEFIKFVRYNARDCEILKALEKKLGYMQLAIEMAHSNTCAIPDVLGTVKQTEMAIINQAHHVTNKIIPDAKEAMPSGEKFKGAFVVPTAVGMHKYLATIDVISLYPSTMRTLNISPEMIIGQFHDMKVAYLHIKAENEHPLTILYDDDRSETKTAKEWKQYLKQNNWAISAAGTVFNQNDEGIISSILTSWFEQRKKYKKEMGMCKEEMKKHEPGSLKYIEWEEKSKYFDRLQNIKKLSLNSLYGAMGNAYFKFYDVRMAESTTQSGQEILFHMLKTVGETLCGKYEYPNEAIIAGDTDSVMYATYGENEEETILVGKYIQKIINASFSKFLSESFLIDASRSKYIGVDFENAVRRGIFPAQKNYALNLCYKDGVKDPNIKDPWKIKGLMIKKTSIPKKIRKPLENFVKKLIMENDFKGMSKDLVAYRDEVKTYDYLDLGLPKQIKGLEEYATAYQRVKSLVDFKSVKLPGHVAASINWNECLKKFNDKESPSITSGMKIKVLYFTKKVGWFKAIAIPTDLTIIPQWFIDNFSAIIDVDAQVERLIDSPLNQVLEALQEKMPTHQSLLLDEEFEY